jgi:hypothetical protein
MFGQQQRFEATVPVARCRDPRLTVAGQHSLGGDAVALVARCLRFLRAGLVTKTMRQLGVRRRFDRRLFERDPRGVDRFPGHRTGQELSDQLLRDRGELRDGVVKLFGSARHNTPPWRRLCPAHRITDRLVGPANIDVPILISANVSSFVSSGDYGTNASSALYFYNIGNSQTPAALVACSKTRLPEVIALAITLCWRQWRVRLVLWIILQPIHPILH